MGNWFPASNWDIAFYELLVWLGRNKMFPPLFSEFVEAHVESRPWKSDSECLLWTSAAVWPWCLTRGLHALPCGSPGGGCDGHFQSGEAHLAGKSHQPLGESVPAGSGQRFWRAASGLISAGGVCLCVCVCVSLWRGKACWKKDRNAKSQDCQKISSKSTE